MTDPPNPIPPWLYPQGGATRGESLVMIATAEEWQTVARLVSTLEVPSEAVVSTEWHNGSPWLEITVGGKTKVERFALWRYTLAVHRIDANGAVEDHPMEFPA